MLCCQVRWVPPVFPAHGFGLLFASTACLHQPPSRPARVLLTQRHQQHSHSSGGAGPQQGTTLGVLSSFSTLPKSSSPNSVAGIESPRRRDISPWFFCSASCCAQAARSGAYIYVCISIYVYVFIYKLLGARF